MFLNINKFYTYKFQNLYTNYNKVSILNGFKSFILLNLQNHLEKIILRSYKHI